MFDRLFDARILDSVHCDLRNTSCSYINVCAVCVLGREGAKSKV